MKKERYTVKNVYGIRGVSKHKSVELALKARNKREGIGWVVVDQNGDTWDEFDGNTFIVESYQD